MLNIVTSRSNPYEISEYNIKNILMQLENNDITKIMYIVPDQITLETEKSLLNKLDKDALIQIEVMSFSKYIALIKSYINKKIDYKLISNNCILTILNKLLLDNEQDFKYINITRTPGVAESIKNIIDNFKSNNISCENLEELKDIDNVLLRSKISDIQRIYKLYNNYMENHDFLDIYDNTKLVYENIELSNAKAYLKNTAVYFSGFSNFSRLEYMFLSQIILYSNSTTLNICIDTSDNSIKTNEYNTVFKKSSIMLNTIIKIMKDNSIYYNIISLEETNKAKSDIRHMTNNLFKLPYNQYTNNVENISVLMTKNQYTEIETIFQDIISKVKDYGLRYSDFAIFSNNLETYSEIAKVIAKEYNMSIFIDHKTNISFHPLILYITSLLDIVDHNFMYNDIFSFLKTGLTNIDISEIDYIENYVLEYGIKWNSWQTNWSKGEEKYDLDKLNSIRSRVVTPINDFKCNLQGKKKVKDICTEIYNYMVNEKVIEKIDKIIKELEINNMLYDKAIYVQAYEKVIQALENMTELFGDETISYSKYKRIFNQIIKDIEISIIPTSVDQIFIGDISRSKQMNHKYIYIIGVNEGVIPKFNQSYNLLTDNELESLQNDSGLELEFDKLSNIYKDLFNIYCIVQSCIDKIQFSFPVSTISGESLVPSTYINKLEHIFLQLNTESNVTNDNSSGLNTLSMFSRNTVITNLLSNIKDIDKQVDIPYEWAYIYEYMLSSNESMQKYLYYLNEKSININIKNEVLNMIYSDEIKTSISRLELFSRCPFSHFMQYTLNLKERKLAKITNIDIGNFLHNIIDNFMKIVIDENMEWGKLLENDMYKDIIRKIVENDINDIWDMDNKNKNLKNKLYKTVNNVILSLIYEYTNSDLSLYGTELEFDSNPNSDFNSIIIELTNKKKLIIRGKIDKLDTIKYKDENYALITDFKSSNKDISMDQVYDGLQLQLFTYMDAIINQSKDKNKLLPAGIFYFKMDNPILQVPYDIYNSDVLKNMLISEFKLKGIAIDNIDILKKLDYNIEEKNNKFIDISPNRSKNRLLDKDKFIEECNNIKNIIKSIGDRVVAGDASIKPNKKARYCKYCNFSSICKHSLKF